MAEMGNAQKLSSPVPMLDSNNKEDSAMDICFGEAVYKTTGIEYSKFSDYIKKGTTYILMSIHTS